MRLRLRLQTSRVETTVNESNSTLNAVIRTYSTEENMTKTQELHLQLMAIQSRLQGMQELDSLSTNDVRTQFGATVARFAVYLDRYHDKSLISRLVRTKSMKNEQQVIEGEVKHLNALLDSPEPTPVLEMDGSLQVKEVLPVLEAPQDGCYTGFSDDNNSSNSEIHQTERWNPRNCQLSSVPPNQEEQNVSPFKIQDEVINKARISRQLVVIRGFISRGGFGKVYKGTYMGQMVAVKTMVDVDTFMKEIKLLASLRHPNIVQFIGVAWNSREDFCCVMEYMDGGDLRTLLSKYAEQNRSRGFDFSKIMIAFQVVRALAYLHSRPIHVLHRDLKSKNILLNQTLDAKLTDFGVSREQIVGPMTAEVGTSLWMAPEVMTGKRYDEKADMFSFGVVLSELSIHTLPYSHVKVRPGANQQLMILRRVAMGELSVKFSEAGPQTMAKLGVACVSMDAKTRPTAVEALHVIHAALMQKAKSLL